MVSKFRVPIQKIGTFLDLLDSGETASVTYVGGNDEHYIVAVPGECDVLSAGVVALECVEGDC